MSRGPSEEGSGTVESDKFRGELSVEESPLKKL